MISERRSWSEISVISRFVNSMAFNSTWNLRVESFLLPTRAKFKHLNSLSIVFNVSFSYFADKFGASTV
jgi:hypothetical protein